MTQLRVQSGEKVSVLVAASGTGGHLFPALEIMRAFKRESAEVDLHFVGTGRHLEAEIIGTAGIELSTILAFGLKRRGLWGVLQFLASLPIGCWQTWKLIDRVRPKVVIGVGGYATFLPVMVAWVRGLPTWIHEAEEVPGLANKVLSLVARGVSLAYSTTRLWGSRRTVVTGQPMRQEIVAIASTKLEVAVPQHLLVTGGSQGANSIDQALSELAPWLGEQGVKVRHQCRSENIELVKQAYDDAGVIAKVQPFIADQAEAYQWSHFIVSRSGAGMSREIGIVNRPAIFVPLPHSQAGHQLRNAKKLASAGKALIVEEGSEFTERLRQAIASVLEPAKFREMQTRSYSSPDCDAADKIAEAILNLVYSVPQK